MGCGNSSVEVESNKKSEQNSLNNNSLHKSIQKEQIQKEIKDNNYIPQEQENIENNDFSIFRRNNNEVESNKLNKNFNDEKNNQNISESNLIQKKESEKNNKQYPKEEVYTMKNNSNYIENKKDNNNQNLNKNNEYNNKINNEQQKKNFNNNQNMIDIQIQPNNIFEVNNMFSQQNNNNSNFNFNFNQKRIVINNATNNNNQIFNNNNVKTFNVIAAQIKSNKNKKNRNNNININFFRNGLPINMDNMNNINNIPINMNMNNINNIINDAMMNMNMNINNIFNNQNNNFNFNYFKNDNSSEDSNLNVKSEDENSNINNNFEEKIEETEEERKKREEERKKKEEEEQRRKEEEEQIRKEEEKRRKEEEQRRKEEEKRNIEEEKRKRKEKLEKIKKEIEKNKNNKEKNIKQETERINKEIQEKAKIVEVKMKKFVDEYENSIKKEEEKRKEEDEKEGRWKKYQKVGGEYRSKKEIREKLLPLFKYKNVPVSFEVQPKTNPPYNSGKITEEYLKIPFIMLNFARFMVGIPDDVVNDSSYEKFAQDSSLLQKVNKLMAHFGQPKPQKMENNLYNSGVKGCASCNLYSCLTNLYKGVEGWMIDDGNFTTIGHRRWALNPTMKKSGFGFVDGYAAMYCLDNTFAETEYKNIPWPCRNMTLEFGNTSHWTLSTGKTLSNDIVVTLTNRRTKKIETFSNENPNKFYISNEGYGLKGCIIFEGPLVKQEDSYRVDIKGKDVAISYDVDFFNVICNHQIELIETIEPSCLKKGKKYFGCKKCGNKVEEDIEMKNHNEILLEEINSTCIEEGKKIFKCDFCFEIIEKTLDKIPHNYDVKLISGRTGESSGICKYCEKKTHFMAPTHCSFFWGTGNKYNKSYSGSCPKKCKLNSTLYLWISGINGDRDYRDIIIEFNDPNLVDLKDEEEEIKELYFKSRGELGIIIYPKYNPDYKSEFHIKIE